MKNRKSTDGWKKTFLFLTLVVASLRLSAQVDTVKQVVTDTIKPVPVDTTIQPIKQTTKKKNAIILYGGANINSLNINSSQYEASGGVGYHLGAAYRSGNFFYWQVGARFNHAVYDLQSLSTGADSSILSVNAIDLPLTAGLNLLAFMDRLVSVRAFVSAVPSFNIGVGENKVNLTKDDINSFIMYGQAGVGVDITFLIVEAGYNYGFAKLLKEREDSNPGQFFVNLGVRF